MKRSRLLPGILRGPTDRARPGLFALALFLLQLLGLAAGAAAQTPDGSVSASECCIGAVFPAAARAIGLGQATVADTAPDAFFSNPAGLALLTAKRIVVFHAPLLEDDQVNAVSLLLRPWGIGTLGFTYELLDLGSQEATDSAGNARGDLFDQEHVLAATFAAELGAGLSGGLTYELYIRHAPCGEGCEEDVGGMTAMVDVGVQFRPPRLRWLALGASITHAGLPLQIINQEQADHTPLRLRAGASAEILHFFHADTMLALWTSAQVERHGLRAREQALSLGAQLSVGELFSVRAGYRGGADIVGGGLALGVGFTVDRFVLDVGKVVAGTLLSPEGPFTVSLGILLDHDSKEAARAGPPASH